MAEEKKEKINWVEGGMLIGLTAVIDIIKIILYFLFIGIVLNWIINFAFLLAVSVWLLLKGALTLGRGLSLWQALITGMIPFAMTATISLLLARIIAQDKLGLKLPLKV